MEKACSLCYDLVLHNKAHTALKKISELKGSELYKCCCCYAYLHKHNNEWEIISGGEVRGESSSNHTTNLNTSDKASNEISATQNHHCLFGNSCLIRCECPRKRRA